MADKLKNLVPRLSKRGPHRVLIGDLDFAGIPGRVYAPAEGKGVPGIAFGHDWRVGVEYYHATLRHLASWGFAVAAPDTEKGLAPNHRGLASDLESALQILAGVRLGNGNVTVQPNDLYLAGHGMGASAAVLAATGRAPRDAVKDYSPKPTIAGVMAVFPSDTSPSAYDAAKHVSAPGLVLAAGRFGEMPMGDAKRMAAQWKGDVVYRELDKARSSGFHEKYVRNLLLGLGRPQFSQQELVRALMTGFVLADHKSKYKAFRDNSAELKHTITATQHELFKELPEHVDISTLVSNLKL